VSQALGLCGRTLLHVVMDVQEAVNQAQAHLKNAMELAQRPVGKEELLYMWDNQITALDNFLADTEVLKDKLLDRARESIRKVKKDLTDAVIAFEARQAGEEVPDEPEPSDAEWAEAFLEQAPEMLSLVREALEEPVEDVRDLARWEEPLAIVNGFLADSEPYQHLSHDLQKSRSLVRVARRELKGRIDAVFQQWRAADLKAA